MAGKEQWAVVIVQAPPKGGFLSSLFGGGPRAKIAQAIESLTAIPAGRAGAMLDKLPAEVGRYETQQQAKVAAQTLEDAGAHCEMRQV